MTDTETRTQPPDFDLHRAELAAATTPGAMVRYARDVLGAEAKAAQVRGWLAGYGHRVPKSTLYDNMPKTEESASVSAPRSVTDTSDLPKLTPEQLATLDAALAAGVDGTAEPVTPEPEPEPESAAMAESGVVPSGVRSPDGGDIAIPVETFPSPEPGPEVRNESGASPAESGGESGPESGPPAGNLVIPAMTENRFRMSPDSAPDSSGLGSGSPAGLGRAVAAGPDLVRESEPSPDSGLARARTLSGSPDRSPGESGSPEKSARKASAAGKPLVVWPVLLMALSAFVAIWSGWVGMGEMTGFGVVQLLPGIANFQVNSAITLPIGVEAYASYALYVWLSGRTRTEETRQFAKWSAFGALALGAAGQVAYHLIMQSQAEDLSHRQAAADAAAKAAGHAATVVHATAPWWITTFVACLPVIVVGMGAALAHMVRRERE
jgi:hypothetical protein